MTGELVSCYPGPGPGESAENDKNDSPEPEEGTQTPKPVQHHPFQPCIDWDQISRTTGLMQPSAVSPVSPLPRRSSFASFRSSRRKSHLNSKSADTVERIALRVIETGKERELKNCVRHQNWVPLDPARSRIWQILCNFLAKGKAATTDSLYWDTVKQIYGTLDLVSKTGPLPTFVEPSFQMTYYLNETGIQLARRITTIISYSCPDITYAPSLYPITCILLHYMTEEDTYSFVSLMVASKKTKFITQTKLHYETIWRTAMVLCRRHAKSAVSYIAKQVGDNAEVELIHQQWLTYIFKALPFQHLIRVMDCFLCEGRKVMYRVWIAILILFHRQQTSSSPSTRSSVSKESSLESNLMNFCREMPYSPEKLLRTAYRVRNFRSTEMDRLFIKTEMYLKSRAAAASTPGGVITRTRSNELLPTNQSQFNIQMMSHTLTIQELLTLWSWLPVRITMYQPELLYTTEEHGCSMTTFFNRVEQHEPTVVIVKTTTGDVFGAYCSGRWAQRNSKDYYGGRQGYFGTGETFVFTLVPEQIKYPWVGIANSSADGPTCLRHAAELFMASDGHMITIGGGKGHAIWIDENIRFGKTERCLTFNNPPLSSSMDFEIRVLEVYGFQNL